MMSIGCRSILTFMIWLLCFSSIQVKALQYNLSYSGGQPIVTEDNRPEYNSLNQETHPEWGNNRFGPHLLPASENMPAYKKTHDSTRSIILLWILVAALAMGLARYLFPSRFKEILLAPVDSKFMTQLAREGGLINNWVSFILFLNYLFALSLLLYQTAFYLGINNLFAETKTILLLLYGLIITVIYYFLKYVLVFLTSWVFRTKAASVSYFRHLLVVNKLTGIILLPALAINYFNPTVWAFGLLWVFMIVLGVYKITKVFPIGLSIPGLSAFHIILYLCTIEIIPIIIFIKITLSYI